MLFQGPDPLQLLDDRGEGVGDDGDMARGDGGVAIIPAADGVPLGGGGDDGGDDPGDDDPNKIQKMLEKMRGRGKGLSAPPPPWKKQKLDMQRFLATAFAPPTGEEEVNAAEDLMR